jgi:hypothetical protein
MKEHLNGRGLVSESSNHLSAIELEQLAEDALSAAEAVEARLHLSVCARCSREVDTYKNLFSLLGQLPRLAPSPAFADAVMARVHLAPRESAVTAWLRRLIPTTRRGWLLLGTIVTAPATPILALIAWMLVQPLVTPSNLWQWTQLRAQSISQASIAWLADQAVNIGSWNWVAALYSTLQSVPTSAIAGVTVLTSIAIPLSAWGLLKLIRTPGDSVTYAN